MPRPNFQHVSPAEILAKVRIIGIAARNKNIHFPIAVKISNQGRMLRTVKRIAIFRTVDFC